MDNCYKQTKRKAMKKILLLLTLIVGSVWLLSSCGSTYKLNVDKTPLEQSATIHFDSDKNFFGTTWYVVQKWNDYDIRADVYGNDTGWASGDDTELIVPAGENTFVFHGFYSSEGRYSVTTYEINEITFQYNLEQGKKYEIRGKTKLLGFIDGYEFFIEFYDITKGRVLLEEWSVGKSRDFERK
jgi:hypothetical protein